MPIFKGKQKPNKWQTATLPIDLTGISLSTKLTSTSLISYTNYNKVGYKNEKS